MAIIDVSTPQNVVDEYNSYSRLYDYNARNVITPLSIEEFIHKYLPPEDPKNPITDYNLRYDAMAFKRHKKYVDADFCFRLKNMGFNFKGRAAWKEFNWTVNYPPKICNLEFSKSNSECNEDEAIIPYYEHDYLKFLYEFNQKNNE